jgi:hypothetical protein
MEICAALYQSAIRLCVFDVLSKGGKAGEFRRMCEVDRHNLLPEPEVQQI